MGGYDLNTGGAFFSAKLPPMGDENPNDVIRQYCVVWGTATYDADDNAQDVDENDQRKGKRRTVSFRVRYGEEPIKYPLGYVRKKGEKLKRTKFMNCRAIGFDNVAAVMSSIEKNDMVLCFGRTTYRKRTNKDGKEIRYYEMRVDLVLPMEAIAYLMRLYASPRLNAILEADDNDAPDAWESD